jgi:hypothetical protein
MPSRRPPMTLFQRKALLSLRLASGLLLMGVLAFAASPPCDQDPVKDSGLAVAEARKRFDEADRLAGADRFAEAIVKLKSIGWLPGQQRPGNDPDLSNAIWRTFAKSYINSVPPQYCNAARSFGYLLMDGYTVPDVADNIESALIRWDMSKEDRAGLLSTIPFLLRLVDQHIDRVPAQHILRELAKAGQSKEVSTMAEDLAIELYATGYWPVSDFKNLERQKLNDLLEKDALKDKKLWADVCRAYGFDSMCKSDLSLSDASKPNLAKDLFPSIAASILPEYDSSPSLVNVFHPHFGSKTNTGERVRLFTLLLSQVARNLYSTLPAGGLKQALYRWEAAYFLDRNDLSSARFAASLIADQADLDQGFVFANAVVNDLKLSALSAADSGNPFVRLFRVNPNSRSAPSHVIDTGDLRSILELFALAKHPESIAELDRVKVLKLDKTVPLDPLQHQVANAFEGDQVVQGSLPATHPNLVLTIAVWSSGECNANTTPPLWGRAQQTLAYAAENQRRYTVPLPVPLNAGQCVQVSWPDAATTMVDTKPVQIGTSGWGRSRLYGRIGAQLFPPGVAHDGAATFFGSLTYDFAFRAETVPTDLTPKTRWPLGLHGYLEGRLDSISTSLKVTDINLASGRDLGERCGRRDTCAGTPVGGRIGEAGFYAPWLIPHSSHYYQGSAVGWFAAPLIKVGTQGRDVDPGPPGTIIPLSVEGYKLQGEELRSGPFDYRAAGVRFGQIRYFSSRSRKGYAFGQIAPVLMLNVDFTYGHWQNFTLPPFENFKTLPWRRELRANFSVAPIPAFFGFYWNSGAGPDDLRFFIGMRYEFAQLAERIRRAHLRR